MGPASRLNDQLRAQARRLGVSLAQPVSPRLGQVIARTSAAVSRSCSARSCSGRMRAGGRRRSAMACSSTRWPLRLDLGDVDVETSVRQTHARLADLLRPTSTARSPWPSAAAPWPRRPPAVPAPCLKLPAQRRRACRRGPIPSPWRGSMARAARSARTTELPLLFSWRRGLRPTPSA